MVRDYWKSLEPAYYDFALKINRGDKRNADESMKQKMQDLEWNYLDRKNYGSVTLRSFSLEPPRGKTIDVPRQRYMLYENGMAVDGSKRYLQFIYFIPLQVGMPLDMPMRDILAVHYFDISHEFTDFSGSYGTYNSSDEFSAPHIALGVLSYQGLALPWELTKPNKKVWCRRNSRGGIGVTLHISIPL